MIDEKNNYKIEMTKGTTFALNIKFKNISENLRSAYFTVKMNIDDETPVIQKSLGAGITLVDDRSYKNEKSYKLQIQPADTLSMQCDAQYLYDLQCTVGGVVKTILSGFFVVKQSITGFNEIISPSVDISEVNELEYNFETTPATNGIEYEQDPVALNKIGDLTSLTTTAKSTLVSAINENKATIDADKSELDGDIATLTADIETNEQTINSLASGLADGTIKPLNATNTTNAVNNSNGTFSKLEKDGNGILKTNGEIIARQKLIFNGDANITLDTEYGSAVIDFTLALENGKKYKVEGYSTVNGITENFISQIGYWYNPSPLLMNMVAETHIHATTTWTNGQQTNTATGRPTANVWLGLTKSQIWLAEHSYIAGTKVGITKVYEIIE